VDDNVVIFEKVISGGQTGVDRAGLDAAMQAGIPVGGYCPKGRLAEDGTVPEKYPLIELTKGGSPARTEKNVMESDGTLILNVGTLSGGTRFTRDCARKHAKPYLIVKLDRDTKTDVIKQWAKDNRIRVLNIAGPRESKQPGLHVRAFAFLCRLFLEE
jgi:predicted Rossmann-fold nucleotide-binding protein